MMQIVGYLRVSTDEQADSGLGLAAQRAAIEAAAARLGATVASWFTDEGISGGAEIDQRLGLLAAIQAILPGGVLLVAKRDRLARGMLQSCLIEGLIAKRRGTIRSAAGEGTDGDADDPSGQLMRRIVDSFAEYERHVIKARTRAALRVKAARGERISRFAPIGYRLDQAGKLVADHAEQQLAAKARGLRATGLSLRGVAAELKSQGLLGRTGKQLSAKTVRAICTRAGA